MDIFGFLWITVVLDRVAPKFGVPEPVYNYNIQTQLEIRFHYLYPYYPFSLPTYYSNPFESKLIQVIWLQNVFFFFNWKLEIVEVEL